MEPSESSFAGAGCDEPRDHELWVDQVGVFRVSLAREFLIGGPNPVQKPGQIALQARLSRRQAGIVRSGESYLVLSERGVIVGDSPRQTEHLLADGAVLDLGEGVSLRFRMPHRLSPSARLEFLSDHRPVRRADAVILMSGTCLLGPGSDCHLVCPGWSQTVILLERQGALWLKMERGVLLNGRSFETVTRLEHGDIVEGDDFRFRVEVIG